MITMLGNQEGTPLLEVNNLSVAYGKVEALSNFNMRVNQGQIVSVVGPNGAGKTTLLSAIMGVLGSKGNVDFDGHVEQCPQVEQMVIRGLGLVPEKRELFGTMSIEDNLMLGAFQRYRQRDKEIFSTLDEVYDIFPRLKERRSQQAGTLSGGERQMLAVGRALMAKPKLLMLDEPSLGLAPLITREIFKVIDQLRGHGVSILLVEQNARAALKLADYAYVLEMGELSMEGRGSDLVEDPRIIESYLGINSKHQDVLAI
ncbi:MULTISPECIES: ABC transporter ATP-binding protein [unclassified Acinetobacter]|uniref:ABC transporter ATP-binding protein n=1 Tax=unclassified Acinetobacter TaxID=196816 RepID=UPI0004481440|nr:MULTISPECIES: ABC transporter ATP-binding protein [unclassified Acinetobacter]EZQ10645.1 metal-dependent hydrolase [Acinetobacter sp. Ver3]SEM05004.1 amino acid/amide ABC transporter ATP-binding protein 2, HAAT family [Acinetobacter sp. DSM 11652]